MVELGDVIKIEEVIEIVKKIKYPCETAGGQNYIISVPLFMDELTKLKTQKDKKLGGFIA